MHHNNTHVKYRIYQFIPGSIDIEQTETYANIARNVADTLQDLGRHANSASKQGLSPTWWNAYPNPPPSDPSITNFLLPPLHNPQPRTLKAKVHCEAALLCLIYCHVQRNSEHWLTKEEYGILDEIFGLVRTSYQLCYYKLNHFLPLSAGPPVRSSTKTVLLPLLPALRDDGRDVPTNGFDGSGGPNPRHTWDRPPLASAQDARPHRPGRTRCSSERC